MLLEMIWEPVTTLIHSHTTIKIFKRHNVAIRNKSQHYTYYYTLLYLILLSIYTHSGSSVSDNVTTNAGPY